MENLPRWHTCTEIGIFDDSIEGLLKEPSFDYTLILIRSFIKPCFPIPFYPLACFAIRAIEKKTAYDKQVYITSHPTAHRF